MKMILTFASVAVLAACSPAEDTAEPTETEAVPEAAAEPLALDGNPSVGMYRVTPAEGVPYIQEVRADGTYTNTMEDGETVTGTWRQESPEVFCTTNDAEETTGGQCSDEAMDAEGVWNSVDRGSQEVFTVERVES